MEAIKEMERTMTTKGSLMRIELATETDDPKGTFLKDAHFETSLPRVGI